MLGRSVRGDRSYRHFRQCQLVVCTLQLDSLYFLFCTTTAAPLSARKTTIFSSRLSVLIASRSSLVMLDRSLL